MEKRYCRIAPNLNGSLASSMASAEDPKRQKRKRMPVRVACNSCRTRKTACDGQRGCCEPCKKKGTPCVYISDNIDDTPAMALRRQHEKVQLESDKMAVVIEFLRSATDSDASDGLKRIRQSDDISEVYDWIKYGTVSSEGDMDHDTPAMSDSDDLTVDQSPPTISNSETENVWIPYEHEQSAWDAMEQSTLSVAVSGATKDNSQQSTVTTDNRNIHSYIDPQILSYNRASAQQHAARMSRLSNRMPLS